MPMEDADSSANYAISGQRWLDLIKRITDLESMRFGPGFDVTRLGGRSVINFSGFGDDGVQLYRLDYSSGAAGGFVGTAEVFCSYKYDVYAAEDAALANRLYSDQPLGTGMVGHRIIPAEMTKATWGLGRVVAGSFMLIDAFEQAAGYVECDTTTTGSGSGST